MPDRYGPFRNHRFLLEVDGIAEAAFSEATIPEASAGVVEYREGNEPPTNRKLKGLNSYGNITLSKGVTESTELYDWWVQVEQGKLEEARRDNAAIVILDEEGNPGPRYQFRNVWISQYDAPDLDASGDAVAIESLELVHEGMERAA
jgi:phage tail-like protein